MAIRRKRRKDNAEEEGHERWLVSYADFMTLLFAFFVVLYATSEKNKDSGKEFEESIKKYLVKIQVFNGAGKRGSDLSKLINKGGENDLSALERPLDKYKKGSRVENEKVAKLQNKLERSLEEALSEDQLSSFVYDLVDDEWGVRIVLSSKYLFKSGDILFNKKAMSAFKKLGHVLRTLNVPMIVEGHTVEAQVQLSSKYPTPWELSSLRATRVLRYLVKIHGLNPKNLSVLSFGKQRPVIPDQTDYRNDRIEIIVLSGDSPI